MLRIVIIALLLSDGAAFAGYDKSWFVADYWSGEYPPGFAVTGDGVVLKGRAESDPDLAADIDCPVPKRAVFQPWNESRKAVYRTYSKIVPLTVKADFSYEFIPADGVPATRKVAKGDTLEYLIYGAEGSFQVRHKNDELTAGQDLFDHVETVEQSSFVEQEWVQISCENGKNAWVRLSELRTGDGWIAGIGDPNITEYGKATDLAE